MDKWRLFERIRQSPRTVRPNELCRLLELFGYEPRDTPVRGSHLYYYTKRGCRSIHFPRPHPSKEVKVCYVRRIIRILETERPNDEIEEN
jgi:predicted RNA binding protein YcfA (HicA-like mRNA interferase family)